MLLYKITLNFRAWPANPNLRSSSVLYLLLLHAALHLRGVPLCMVSLENLT